MNLQSIKRSGPGGLPYPPGGAAQARRTMTVSDAATPFGCCTFFDHCSDEIVNLSYNGTLGLLDWLGFNVSEDCYRSVEFINYNRPEQSGGACTVGYLSDPCADPNGIEFGGCKITVEDFGLLGREGPTRQILQPKRYCKTYPKYRLDGSPVTSEFEWDMLYTAGVVLDDVKRMVVNGNANVAGQFDGLQQWVATGYACSMLDSIVINWNNNGMNGGAGITWNGVAQGAGFDLVDALLAAFRHIKDRISWAPLLKGQRMTTGDMVIIGPSFLLRCLLDQYACWSVCPGAQYEEVIKNAKEIRDFRLTLDGGLFGDGQISLDGFTIPLMNYDWATINSQNTGDIYLLTGSIGAVRVFEGEFLSGSSAVSAIASETGDTQGLFSRDGGRIIGRIDSENLCRTLKLWMALRLFCMAPWAQVRLQNVACEHFGPTISPDPCDTCFYPETCFTPAECP